jgi:hypothetical protein
VTRLTNQGITERTTINTSAMAKQKTYYRSRIEILNYIIVFSTGKVYGPPQQQMYSNNHISTENSFYGSYGEDSGIPISSLVMLTSAPFTKWYLSWLIEKDPTKGYGGSWLLQSIEDGSLIWWSNVSIFAYPKETSDKFPQWKWDDAKFKFNDQWNRACKKCGAYIKLPMLPEFTDDGGVVLRLRTRFGLDGDKPERKFENWKKVRVSDMIDFYKHATKK